ncbi:MAG: hypothetical protein WAU54_09490, partial [Chania sp.]
FKLEKKVDVKVYLQDVELSDGSKDNNKGDNISANETSLNPWIKLSLSKQWCYFLNVMKKKRFLFFVYSGVLLALLFAVAFFYFLKPLKDTPSYVSTVVGCKVYSIYQVDNEQKDKYRRYAEYFLQSQEKRCTPDEMLLMHVQDEHGFSEVREGNNRAFFAICNFIKETSDFCKSVYSYSMVLP